MANVDQVRSELKPVVDAQCGWLFKCCSAGELAQQLGPATTDDCSDHLIQSATVSYPYGLTNDTATQSLLAALNYLQYGFDRSAITIDTAAIATCAAAIAAKDCNPAPAVDHCTPVAPPTDDPCTLDKLLVGSLAAGADCAPYGADECAPGLTCMSVASYYGVCTPVPAVGDLCLRDNDCGGSLLCDWSTGKCTAGAADGAACSYSDPDHPVPGTEAKRCAVGLVCDTIKLKCTDARCAAGANCVTDAQCPAGIACVMNSCGPLHSAGDSCNQATDCADGICAYDQLAQRQLCATPKAAGELCNQASDCASGFCNYDNTAMASICVATQKDGDPCPSGQGQECVSGKCLAQVCTAVKAGAACTIDNDCAPSLQLFCIDSACTKAPFANGKGCTGDTQCQSGACVALKCAAKGAPKDACGGATDAPCDESSFCDVADGASTGKCAAKKAQGELCSRDIECVSNCQVGNGERRCSGEPAGVASCGGT
jgi:hypothetical protein